MFSLPARCPLWLPFSAPFSCFGFVFIETSLTAALVCNPICVGFFLPSLPAAARVCNSMWVLFFPCSSSARSPFLWLFVCFFCLIEYRSRVFITYIYATLTRRFQVPKVRTAQHTDHFPPPCLLLPVELFFLLGASSIFLPVSCQENFFLVFLSLPACYPFGFFFFSPPPSLSLSVCFFCFWVLSFSILGLCRVVLVCSGVSFGFFSPSFPACCPLRFFLGAGGFSFSSLPPAH